MNCRRGLLILLNLPAIDILLRSLQFALFLSVLFPFDMDENKEKVQKGIFNGI